MSGIVLGASTLATESIAMVVPLADTALPAKIGVVELPSTLKGNVPLTKLIVSIGLTVVPTVAPASTVKLPPNVVMVAVPAAVVLMMLLLQMTLPSLRFKLPVLVPEV